MKLRVYCYAFVGITVAISDTLLLYYISHVVSPEKQTVYNVKRILVVYGTVNTHLE